MKTSESIIKISEALCSAQAEFIGAKKDAANPFFKSHYADMASVIESTKPGLTKYGLGFIQGVVDNMMATRLIHKSGEWIETYYPLSFKDPSDPQKVGSAATYAKRYGLQAALGVPSIDDDGESAVERTQQPLAPKMQALKEENAQQVIAVKPKFEPPKSVRERADAVKPLFPKVVEGSSDLGSYIIRFGKHKDQMLSDLDIYALDGYIKWLKDSAIKSGKPMAGNAQELCEAGEAYIKSRLGGGTPVPGFDPNEEIPF